MRVLQAPIAALYQPHLFVKGLREVGVYAESMVHDLKGFEWLTRTADFNLSLRQNKGLQYNKSIELEFLNYVVQNYDIVHLHSGFSLLDEHYSLWSNLSDLNYLKSQGLKLVMSWWGCDLRTEDVDIKYKWSGCNKCHADIRATCKLQIKKDRINKAFELIDLHLSSGDLVVSYENIQWLDIAIDCDELSPLSDEEIPEKFLLPPTDSLRIYHSFGNSDVRGDVKGTEYVKKAVEQLQLEGHKVEFLFFDKVPNTEIKYYQAQADIIVDQLLCGWHGSTGAECLAMGKPVITYVRPEVRKIKSSHPIIEASPDTILSVLRGLVVNRDELDAISVASRDYALKTHDYRIIAQNLKQLYRGILQV